MGKNQMPEKTGVPERVYLRRGKKIADMVKKLV